MYELLFSPATKRYFRKPREKHLRAAYRAALLKIVQDPYIGDPKHGDLAGIYGFDVSYQGTNYEIAYTIREENDQKVVVLLAGTRENFYEQLKRYME